MIQFMIIMAFYVTLQLCIMVCEETKLFGINSSFFPVSLQPKHPLSTYGCSMKIIHTSA